MQGIVAGRCVYAHQMHFNVREPVHFASNVVLRLSEVVNNESNGGLPNAAAALTR